MNIAQLKEIFNRNMEQKRFLIPKMLLKKEKPFYVNPLALVDESLAVCFLYLEGNLMETKNCYYEAAMAQRYWYETLKRDIFTIPKIFLYPILSDSSNMINSYLHYDESELKKPGTFTYHFGKAVQAVLKDDRQDLAMRIEWLDKRSKNGPMKLLNGAVIFFEGILNRDIEKIKQGIINVQKKMQSNQPIVIKDYFCLEATGLAKLAWRKGFEVDIDSPFIPKAMLPIKELEHYESFDFFDESVVV